MPISRIVPRLRAALMLAAGGVVSSSGVSIAQEPLKGGFSLDHYEPTPAGDRLFAVPSGAVDGDKILYAGLVLDYAKAPLVLRDTCVTQGSRVECNRAGSELGRVVAHEMILHVGLSFGLWDRVLLSLNLPVALVNMGDDQVNPRASSTVVQAPDHYALGDLRAGVRLQVLGETRGPAELAVGGYLWLPTGSPDQFTGDDGVRGMPHLAMSGKLGWFFYDIHGGLLFRKQTEFANVGVGSELTWGAAAGITVVHDRVQLGPEFYGGTVVSGVTNPGTPDELDVLPFSGRTTHDEVLGSLRVRGGAFVFGAAAGPGLGHGFGTPMFRALATVAFSPTTEPDGDGDGVPDAGDACPAVKGARSADASKSGCPDTDGDGIFDAQDGCPRAAGSANADPTKNGCPALAPADRDGDGITDESDACPDTKGAPSPEKTKNGCPGDRDDDGVIDDRDACVDVPGVISTDPRQNGCPSDRDGDGIVDEKDACPEVAGSPNDDRALNGCPGDADGDSIRDDKDACPREKGPGDADAQKNGCPQFVRVEKSQIKLLQQIQFAPGSARLPPGSEAVLREVAAVLKEHAEIKKVRVDGNTDPRGSHRLNAKLSEQRARVVMKWLVDKGGVDAARLEVQGLADVRPAADNTAVEGRRANPRVEFTTTDPAP